MNDIAPASETVTENVADTSVEAPAPTNDAPADSVAADTTKKSKRSKPAVDAPEVAPTEIPSGCPGCLSTDPCACFEKNGVTWRQCANCGTITHESAVEDTLGGDSEGERNKDSINAVRLQRMTSCPDVKTILDFGCGSGLFVDYMTKAGYDATGFDPHSEQYGALPTGPFDAVSLVEVIEHLRNPEAVLANISGVLRDGGYLMIESSFINKHTVERLIEWSYVDHAIGHVTVLSQEGLNLLLNRAGFHLAVPINENVWIFQKN
jgi:hypothetical protein